MARPRGATLRKGTAPPDRTVKARLGIAPRPARCPAAEHAHIGGRGRSRQAHWRVAPHRDIPPGACTIRTSGFTYTAGTARPPRSLPTARHGVGRRAGHEGVMLLGPRSGSSQTAGHSPLLIPCIACRACVHVYACSCALRLRPRLRSRLRLCSPAQAYLGAPAAA